MTISENSSPKPSPKIPKWVPIVFILASFLGFLEATYLTVEHYLGVIPPCSVINGCEKVLTSPYAAVGGVPVALAGAIYYVAILLLTLVYLDTGNERLMVAAARLTPVGFLGSLALVYLQVFVIGALCLYCLVSAGLSAVLFGIGLAVLVRRRAES